MLLHRIAPLPAFLFLIAAGCSALNPSTQPSTAPSTLPSAADANAPAGSAEWWAHMTQPLHGQGAMTNKVYTVIIPRSDLWLQSEMGDIPAEAGISSKFYFYRCDCGLMKVVGEFVLPDYESNDVLDALRAGQFTIASIAPILMDEKPRMLSIRFQAEGHTDELVKVLTAALQWTGPSRSSTRPAAF